MLIITAETNAESVNCRLEGSLADPGVGELARRWLTTALDQPRQRVSFASRGVTHATCPADVRSTMLRVEGALRAPIEPDLRARVEVLLRCGVRRVLLDLTGVSDIDAAGVGELIAVFNMAVAAGGAVEITRANRHVHRVLEVAGVLRLLTEPMTIA